MTGKAKSGAPRAARVSHKQRLAAALRANLKRRKAQARLRAKGQAQSGNGRRGAPGAPAGE